MIPPKKMTAISCVTGGRRHFKSIGDMVKQLGINRTYAVERINSGTPCKGWLLYDTDHDTSPEAREAMRRHVKGFEAKCQAKQSKREAFVSVRIDSRTTISSRHPSGRPTAPNATRQGSTTACRSTTTSGCCPR